MIKRVFRPFWSYDVIATEQWLTDMAASGLLLRSVNFRQRIFTFEAAQPQSAVYRIDFDKQQQGISQTLANAGWSAVDQNCRWVIYANREPEIFLFPQRERVINKTRSMFKLSSILLMVVGFYLLTTVGVTVLVLGGNAETTYVPAPYPKLDYVPYLLVVLNLSFLAWIIYTFIKTRKTLQRLSAAAGYSVDPTLLDIPNQRIQKPNDLSSLIKIRKMQMFWIYNLDPTTEWLEAQAAQGLLLKHIHKNHFFFEKGQPRRVKYFFDTQQNVTEGYFDIHSQAGFNLLFDSRLQFGRLILWSKEYKQSQQGPKMFSDKTERLACAKRLLVNNLKTILFWLALGAVQLFVAFSSLSQEINPWFWMPITVLWLLLITFYMITLFMSIKSYLYTKQNLLMR